MLSEVRRVYSICLFIWRLKSNLTKTIRLCLTTACVVVHACGCSLRYNEVSRANSSYKNILWVVFSKSKELAFLYFNHRNMQFLVILVLQRMNLVLEVILKLKDTLFLILIAKCKLFLNRCPNLKNEQSFLL